ncbi:hypothetical protein [Actinoplanes palleronii]|uniref:hypothetical protein n=1 Tax=Actinoplanes palleronii TaxID=113570 RepID=UPI0019428544|nr:hypothetical protein [Actinoplanes palleronii]
MPDGATHSASGLPGVLGGGPETTGATWPAGQSSAGRARRQPTGSVTASASTTTSAPLR